MLGQWIANRETKPLGTTVMAERARLGQRKFFRAVREDGQVNRQIATWKKDWKVTGKPVLR
jgi:hypothetical protein